MSDFKTPANRHCREPATCSVCLGAVPMIVTVVDGVTHLDGVPVAPAIPDVAYSRRPTRGKR